MNLNQSIIKIRVDLQNSTIKKSGKNKHAGFSYYELSDFLPKLNELMLENGINDIVSINNELASITLVKDAERETFTIPFIMFDTPLANSGKKMMQDIQYLGALNTYLKRYLYLNAFGITDGEVIDSIDNTSIPVKTTSNYTNEKEAKDSETTKSLAKIMGKLNNEDNKDHRAVVISTICKERKVDKWSDITFTGNFTYKWLIERVAAILKNEKELAQANI